jgi:hypothetical protein
VVTARACAGDEGTATYSLVDGLGARRLNAAAVRAHVQSMLVQSCVSIHTQQHTCMSAPAVTYVVQAIAHICAQARLVRAAFSLSALVPSSLGCCSDC